MTLLKLLWKESAPLLTIAVLSSIACALLLMLLLRNISLYVGNPGVLPVTLPVFAALAIGSAGAQFCATVIMQYVAANTARSLRTGLVERIADAPLMDIERRGSAKLLNNLGEDASRVGNALVSSVALTRDLAFAIACLLYLLWLSPTIFGVLAGAIVIGAAVHRPLQARATRQMREVRKLVDRQFMLFRNLIDGAKQLKLSERQRTAVGEGIEHQQAGIARLVVQGHISATAAQCFAVLCFLALIGIMMYGNLADFVKPALVATYTLVIFFLLSPLQNIFGALQSLVQANVAAERLGQLRSGLDAVREPRYVPRQKPDERSPSRAPPVLQLKELMYAYPRTDRTTFGIGPVDIALRGGEVLFVAGGNGSGKTTLVKLLCGLYEPTSGEIRVNDRLIDKNNRSELQAHVSAVFADSVVLDGLAQSRYDEFISSRPDLVRKLRLEDAVQAGVGLMEQASSFSSGERKRFNLLLALLDERPILVFDEFAADQDRDAKEFFYYDFLSEVRASGRLVIVVTHDDRYFSRADRILALERGTPPLILPASMAVQALAPRAAALGSDASFAT